MKHLFDLKGKFVDALNKMLKEWKYEDLNGLYQQLKEDQHRDFLKDSEIVNIHQRIDDLNEADGYKHYKAWDIAQDIESSKTIVFSKEQAMVFVDFALKKKVNIDLPYRIPYSSVLIQFDNLIDLDVVYPDSTVARSERLGGILLTQDEFQDCKAVMIFSDFSWFSATWEVDSENWGFRHDTSCMPKPMEDFLICLSWALVLFITSENVILERQSIPLPQSVKSKEKTKTRDYYVCRIRGVQYDSQGYEKGAGVKHGIRYDVRGHFRHLATGKTTWVRAHQRGLQNELYVPKTYLVDKKVN